MTPEEWQSIPKLSHPCQFTNCNHCIGRRFVTSTEDDCPCKCHKKEDENQGLSNKEQSSLAFQVQGY